LLVVELEDIQVMLVVEVVLEVIELLVMVLLH